MSAVHPQATDYRLDLAGLLLVALILTLLKAPLFPIDRGYEADEHVYRTLADRLGETPPRYDLLGSDILPRLDPTVYQKRLFLHPPLFAWTMHVVARLSGSRACYILVPLVSNALTLILIWWIGLRLFDRPRARLASALYACCPVAFLCASRLWIDGYLTLWVTASVAAMVWCLRKDSNAGFLLPGAAFGLALLCKFTAIAALGPLVLMWFKSGRKLQWQQVAVFFAPVVLLVGPWVVELWGVYHGPAFSDNRIPDADLVYFPFLLMARHRPVWFYVGGLLLIAPIHAFSYWGAVRSLRAHWDLVAWPMAFILAFTVYGPGNSFQLRFIAPAMPGLCLLAADTLCLYPRRSVWALVPVLACYGLYCGYYTGIQHRELGDVVVPYLYPYLPGLF